MNMPPNLKLPDELMKQLGPLLEKLRERVRDDNNVIESSSRGDMGAAAITSAMNQSDAYYGIVDSLPKVGDLDSYHEHLRGFASAVMNRVFPGKKRGDPLKSASVLAISTAFVAQLAEDDPELYQFILIVCEGQWEDDPDQLSRIIAALSYILLFLNWRSGNQRLWLQGEK